MSTDAIDKIKSGLSVTGQEEEPTWSQPYVSPSKAPPGFPYGEKRLLSVEDARKVKSTADALFDRQAKLKEADEKYTNLRRETEEEIAKLKESESYAKIKGDITGFVDKLGTEIIDSMGDASDILYRHGNTLLAVYNVLEKPTNVPIDKQQLLRETLMKYVSGDIAGQILDESDKAVKEANEAAKILKNKLAVWPEPKGVEKKVIQTETSLKKDAFSITEFLSGIWDALKSFYNKAKEAVSSMLSYIQAGDPLIDQMQTTLGEVGATVASKTISKITSKKKGKNMESSKKKADYRGSQEAFENRHQYQEALQGLLGAESLLDNLVSALSDAEAFDNFDYIAQMYDITFTSDGQAMTTDDYQEQFGEESSTTPAEPTER